MPITLGCPSCGKRFRARDESAGKKVKCPYCQAAVPVPTADESANAAAPTAPLPAVPDSATFPPPVSRPAASPPPRPAPAPVVASPDDWGAVPSAPSRPLFPPEPEPEPTNPFPPVAPLPTRGDKPRPKPAKPQKGEGKKAATETPEEALAKGWLTVRRGLFWVQFALFWVSLLGFVGFGKMVYERAVGPIPTGDGWLKVDGYLNTPDQNAIQLSKSDEIDLLAYGLPICMAGVALTFGRLTASGGPRNSGARGLFACGGLLTFVSFVALLATVVCDKMLFRTEGRYAYLALLILAPLAEFWFLVGLTACGSALKRPRVARAVGAVGFVFALIPALATVGWEQYVANGRPRKPDADWLLYEQAALMIGWLILVGTYWRAVRGVRVAANDFAAAVEDKE